MNWILIFQNPPENTQDSQNPIDQNQTQNINLDIETNQQKQQQKQEQSCEIPEDFKYQQLQNEIYFYQEMLCKSSDKGILIVDSKNQQKYTFQNKFQLSGFSVFQIFQNFHIQLNETQKSYLQFSENEEISLQKFANTMFKNLADRCKIDQFPIYNDQFLKIQRSQIMNQVQITCDFIQENYNFTLIINQNFIVIFIEHTQSSSGYNRFMSNSGTVQVVKNEQSLFQFYKSKDSMNPTDDENSRESTKQKKISQDQINNNNNISSSQQAVKIDVNGKFESNFTQNIDSQLCPLQKNLISSPKQNQNGSQINYQYAQSDLQIRNLQHIPDLKSDITNINNNRKNINNIINNNEDLEYNSQIVPKEFQDKIDASDIQFDVQEEKFKEFQEDDINNEFQEQTINKKENSNCELSSRQDDDQNGIPIGDVKKIFCDSSRNYLSFKEYYQDDTLNNITNITQQQINENNNTNNTKQDLLKSKNKGNISLNNNNRSVILFSRDFPDKKPNEKSEHNLSYSSSSSSNSPKQNNNNNDIVNLTVDSKQKFKLNLDKINPQDLLTPNDMSFQNQNQNQPQSNQSQSTYRKYLKYNKHACKCNKILIIDDNMFTQNALIKIFQVKYMLNSLSAITGQPALNTVKFQFDKNKECCKIFKIIILDYESTKEKGLQTMESIYDMLKIQGYESHMVILCSNIDDNIEKVKNKGIIQTILMKPMDTSIMNDLLENLILKPNKSQQIQKLILKQ